MAFEYNTQVLPSIGHTPFELVLCNPGSSLTLRPERSHKDPKGPSQLFKQFEQAIRLSSKSASRNIDRDQERYKQNYDRRFRPVDLPDVGDWVRVRRETGEEDFSGARRRQNLQRNPTGPFPVLNADEHTVVAQSGEEKENITRQRVVKAPEPHSILSEDGKHGATPNKKTGSEKSKNMKKWEDNLEAFAKTA